MRMMFWYAASNRSLTVAAPMRVASHDSTEVGVTRTSERLAS
jgi:hypothetical protein